MTRALHPRQELREIGPIGPDSRGQASCGSQGFFCAGSTGGDGCEQGSELVVNRCVRRCEGGRSLIGLGCVWGAAGRKEGSAVEGVGLCQGWGEGGCCRCLFHCCHGFIVGQQATAEAEVAGHRFGGGN